MKIRFWGVRGSVPVPGPATVRYGGNTACIEVRGNKGETIILDGGTGLRLLGLELLRQNGGLSPLHLFITHTHWDHIQGFPYFAPSHRKDAEILVQGPYGKTSAGGSLREAFDLQMQPEFFPISYRQLQANIDYHSLKETKLEVGEDIQIATQFTNHSIPNLAYRIEENGRSMVYTGDHEPFGNGDWEANRRFVNFVRGVNLLIADCQYTPEEYRASRQDWGHSSWDYCLQVMKEGGVERMALTHHDPQREDQALDEFLRSAREDAEKMGLDPQKIFLAQEGLELEV